MAPDPCDPAIADCHPETTAQRLAEGRARVRAVRRVFLVTLVLNVGVALAKAIYGYQAGSVALGADAVHSGLDGASNILALIGIHLAAAPADAGHPYGHRKVETLAALGIGLVIVISLVEFGHAALSALVGQRPVPDIGVGGFVLVGITMVVNYLVSSYEHKRGIELDSSALAADAAHTRSDLYASATVLLSFLAARAGWAWADGVGALILVVLVARVAWNVFRDNVPALLDAAAIDPAAIAESARAIDGVLGVHQVRSRGSRGTVHVDLHVEVDAATTVVEAHALTHRLEAHLRQAHPGISDMVIHVEPPHAEHDRLMADSATAHGVGSDRSVIKHGP